MSNSAFGPEYDDLTGEFDTLEERLEHLENVADAGEDGEGRGQEKAERDLDWLRDEIERREAGVFPAPKPKGDPRARDTGYDDYLEMSPAERFEYDEGRADDDD